MKIKVIIHQAEEGGYWAEAPSVPGCVSQGETREEVRQNIKEAIEGCLEVDVINVEIAQQDEVLEIAV